MRAYLLTFLLLTISCAPLLKQPKIHYTKGELKRIEELIDEVLSDSSLVTATVSIYAVSLQTGTVIYEKNPDKCLVPASNMKLITSLAALTLLGPSYRFRTEFFIDEARNLYVKAYGDPMVKREDIVRIAEELSYRVDTVINIVVDESHFDTVYLGPGWMWDDTKYSYSARISPFVVDDNSCLVIVEPGDSVGAPLKARIIPEISYLQLRIEGVTVPEDSSPTLRVDQSFEGGQNIYRVSGGYPIGSPPDSSWRSVEYPALFFGHLLKEALKREGVTVLGEVKMRLTPDSSTLIYTRYSPPLSQIVMKLNKISSNLIAEILVKTLGAEFRGEPGDWKKGISVIREFLAQGGVDTTRIRNVDGSGLSRYNLLSSRQIVNLLIMGYRNFGVMPEYLSSLPIGGVDGTLRRRFKGFEGRVRAKTGYMWGVLSLSGYVPRENGDIIAFSILINNYLCPTSKVKEIQDKIVMILGGT